MRIARIGLETRSSSIMLSSRLSTLVLAAAVAPVLLLACSGSAGSESLESQSSALEPAPAQMASEGLAWFASSHLIMPGQQIGGGETVARLLADSGMVWHDANTAEMLADYALATGDTTYDSTLAAYRGYDGRYVFGSSSDFGHDNSANDDKLWWALAMIRIYDELGDRAFLGNAETIFEDVCQSWSYATESCGGGVTWTNDGNYLNAITNELFFETSAKLALRDGAQPIACIPQGLSSAGIGGNNDPLVKSPDGTVTTSFPNTYAGWATAEWSWLKQYWFRPAGSPSPRLAWPPSTAGHLPIPDGLGSDCIPGDSISGHDATAVWTYNQGVILGALADLITLQSQGFAVSDGDTATTLEEFGMQIATTAMNDLSQDVNGVPILTEKPDDGTANNCVTSPDCPQFKGIFMRYLGRFTASAQPSWSNYWAFQPAAVTYLATNANQLFTMAGEYPGGSGTWFREFPEKWEIPQNVLGPYYQQAETSALDAVIAAVNQHVIATPGVNPIPGPACTSALSCSGVPFGFPNLVITCPAVENFYEYYGSPNQEVVAVATSDSTLTDDLLGAVTVCDRVTGGCSEYSTYASPTYCGSVPVPPPPATCDGRSKPPSACAVGWRCCGSDGWHCGLCE